jgi:hypothetical protein
MLQACPVCLQKKESLYETRPELADATHSFPLPFPANAIHRSGVYCRYAVLCVTVLGYVPHAETLAVQIYGTGLPCQLTHVDGYGRAAFTGSGSRDLEACASSRPGNSMCLGPAKRHPDHFSLARHVQTINSDPPADRYA